MKFDKLRMEKNFIDLIKVPMNTSQRTSYLTIKAKALPQR